MVINTASAVISLARKLEEDGARFYEDLAQRYPQGRATFLAMAGENRKNVVHVERAYYGVISDALEGCFAFNMNPEKYTLNTGLASTASYTVALSRAIELEEMTVQFYTEAAEQCKSLLADVPRAFALIAGKRNARKDTLQSWLDKG
ncbi:MAG: hypothetical protein HY668_01450 [Chloroflexi bacterium]|nr:hypothetical protein [Chloroflexota bacterium]